MKVYRSSELRLFLQELGLDAKKGLSQNFLIDGNILRKIIQAAGIQPGDRVIEIGPGPGALTEFLLDYGASVTAIELDPHFAQALKRLQEPGRPLTIFQKDFLKFPLEDFLANSTGKIKVVANLPYHITTPILTKLLPMHHSIESVTIMVQKEFAKRMTAPSGSSDYGSFSVFTAFYSQPTYCFTVEPTCFYPRPKVQSAVVCCLLKPPLLTPVQEEAFFVLTRSAFQKKRKMLRTSLKSLYSAEAIEQALGEMGISVQARPEELSLEQFLILFGKLSCGGDKIGKMSDQ
jgi:16S rRNA (adenine1518-N6/adenine1519-N6)-dimethyltransferase